MGVTLAASGDEVLSGAPRWFKEVYSTVYFRGRVSVFKEDDSISYETVPCENGKFIITVCTLS